MLIKNLSLRFFASLRHCAFAVNFLFRLEAPILFYFSGLGNFKVKFVIDMKHLLLKSLVIALALFSCSDDDTDWRHEIDRADYLHQTVKQVTDVIVHDIFSPPVASRIYTYMTVAGYEVAIHNDKNYVTLAGQLTAWSRFRSRILLRNIRFSLRQFRPC